MHRLSRPIRSSSSSLSLLIRVNHARIRELYGCAVEEYRLSAFPASIVLSADDYRTLESLSTAESLFFKTGTRSSSSSLAFFFLSSTISMFPRERERLLDSFVVLFIVLSHRRASLYAVLPKYDRPFDRSFSVSRLIVKLVRIIRDQFFDRYWYT